MDAFKPVSLPHSLHSLSKLFTSIFCDTFSSLDNSKLLGHLDTCSRDMRWSDAMQLMSHSLKVGLAKVTKTDQKLVTRWKEVRGKIKTGQEMLKRTDLATVFAFIEGTLTEAVKNGDWILLDEVSMAPASMLECLSQLLEGEGYITFYEAGDYKSIPRHKDFRLFACMNPAPDNGKADLAPGLRNRFTISWIWSSCLETPNMARASRLVDCLPASSTSLPSCSCLSSPPSSMTDMEFTLCIFIMLVWVILETRHSSRRTPQTRIGIAFDIGLTRQDRRSRCSRSWWSLLLWCGPLVQHAVD